MRVLSLTIFRLFFEVKVLPAIGVMTLNDLDDLGDTNKSQSTMMTTNT